jgi:hypothetical protein
MQSATVLGGNPGRQQPMHYLATIFGGNPGRKQPMHNLATILCGNPGRQQQIHGFVQETPVHKLQQRCTETRWGSTVTNKDLCSSAELISQQNQSSSGVLNMVQLHNACISCKLQLAQVHCPCKALLIHYNAQNLCVGAQHTKSWPLIQCTMVYGRACFEVEVEVVILVPASSQWRLAGCSWLTTNKKEKADAMHKIEGQCCC